MLTRTHLHASGHVSGPLGARLGLGVGLGGRSDLRTHVKRVLGQRLRRKTSVGVHFRLRRSDVSVQELCECAGVM